MSQAIAYGSISIVDLTDLGEFSVQPMSNQPLAVIYDPDANSFTPNWGDSNLTVTPSVYYAGRELTLGSSGLTITWQRQEGSGSYTSLTTGETVLNTSGNQGKLSVTANKFTSSSTMLTYIVTATYVEPTTQQSLTAKGQITFTLVKNASLVKDCKITGESVFKYNSSGAVVGGQNGVATIVLTAKVSNVSITAWKYQNGLGEWVVYPNSGTGTTLTVTSSDTTFTNDKCVIKCETGDNTVFDMHTITKLRDGAPGEGTVSAVLTNDDQMIPFDSGGHADWTSATSRIIIYEGGVDVTATWDIQQSYDHVTATPSTTTGANDTVSVSGMSAATGNVTFTCTLQGYNTIVKTFSLVKVQSGADGTSPTIYSVEADNLALNRSTGGALTPSSITFRAFQQTGTTKTAYTGRFKIFENITYQEYQDASPKPAAVYTSSSDETNPAGAVTYLPTASATSVLCILYQSGGTSTILDTQSAVITLDGQKGDQGDDGDPGEDAINIIFGNYSDVLNCTNSNTLIANQTITIPFKAFKGTTQIACSGPSPASQINMTGVKHNGSDITPTVTNATASSDGVIQYSLTAGDSVTTSGGTINMNFTVEGKSVTQTYTWTRTTAATNGQSAVLLQIYTPSGTNVFNQNVSSITMQATLMEGATDRTANATYKWYKWQNGAYTEVSGQTTSSLTVASSTVDSYASYRCDATYTPTGGSSTVYKAYFSLFDKTDPIQVSVLSSIGEQIVNGQGTGAFYVKVTRLGQEIDNLKSDRFMTSAPASPSSGDFYYYLDTTNRTVTLKKFNGSSWANATGTDLPSGTYAWSWRDKDGNPVTSVNSITLPTTGKAVYIDGAVIDTKIIADVEVTIS